MVPCLALEPAVVCVMAVGGAQVTSGQRTVGEFMSFFTALSLAFQPLRRLGGLAGGWQTAAASLERIYAIFDTKPTIRSGPRTRPPADTTIRLEDVCRRTRCPPPHPGTGTGSPWSGPRA